MCLADKVSSVGYVHGVRINIGDNGNYSDNYSEKHYPNVSKHNRTPKKYD